MRPIKVQVTIIGCTMFNIHIGVTNRVKALIGINSDKFNLSGPNYIDPNTNTSKELKPKPGILNSDSLVIKRELSLKLTGADSCLSHTCLLPKNLIEKLTD